MYIYIYICSLFKDTFLNVDYTAFNETEISELDWIWKEAVMVQF
jgi:hypothetical protein